MLGVGCKSDGTRSAVGAKTAEDGANGEQTGADSDSGADTGAATASTVIRALRGRHRKALVCLLASAWSDRTENGHF